MPQPPMLDRPPASDGALSNSNVEETKTPFKLSQLDLGSIGRKSGAKKREAAAAALEDDDDPREEAQVSTKALSRYTLCVLLLSA